MCERRSFSLRQSDRQSLLPEGCDEKITASKLVFKSEFEPNTARLIHFEIVINSIENELVTESIF
ncbi:hypothetical protein WA1_48135 [Scytonema hofmannii PCC 7110]|uniref:Uncharacterized protein n=1 Tax=Scytonema hofmannii PCC 7110 TaxID=128403 RepID=A0A139WYC3_9CYAN|nr:hypothetical protein [Scytonema hofmannii]KYC37382.1 hypothetical protein WA1_48135 [Scytonema hofmannii PCC 7110]